MSKYLLLYDLNNGSCLVPCPHGVKGISIDVVMLGSAFCREKCKHHGDYGDGKYIPGIPVKCLYDEMASNHD